MQRIYVYADTYSKLNSHFWRTSVMDCSTHSGIPASTTCTICNKPICMDCERRLGAQILCESCMTREKNRPAGITNQTQNGAASPESGFARPVSVELAKPNIGMAVLYGFIAAIIGAVIWDKIVFYTHFKLGLVAIGIGIIVGLGVLKGAKSGYSKALPIIGAVMAGFGILLGEYLLLGDMISAEVAKKAIDGQHLSYSGQLFLSMLAFPSYLTDTQMMNPLDWIFVLIGVYQGWKLPARAADSAFSHEKK